MYDLGKCKDAIAEIKNIDGFDLKFTTRIWKSNFPKGCLVYNKGAVYFNEDATGSSLRTARQICEVQGKLLK